MTNRQFRGIKLDGSGWVYGDLIRLPKDSGGYNEPSSQELTTFITNSHVLTHEFIEVIPESVGQARTWGILPESWIGDKAVVKSRGMQFNVEIRECENSLYTVLVPTDEFSKKYELMLDDDATIIKIIGTIHDHLLKPQP